MECNKNKGCWCYCFKGPRGATGVQGITGATGPSGIENKDALLLSFTEMYSKTLLKNSKLIFNFENQKGFKSKFIVANFDNGEVTVNEDGIYMFSWSINLQSERENTNFIISLYKNIERIFISGIPNPLKDTIVGVNGTIVVECLKGDKFSLVNDSNIYSDNRAEYIDIKIVPSILGADGMESAIGAWLQITKII